LKAVYLWNPTDAQLQAIADAITSRVAVAVTLLTTDPNATAYKAEAVVCLANAKTVATTEFNNALATMNTKLDEARADFILAKSYIEGNFTAFNAALDADCSEIVAFESYVLGILSRFAQRILDFGAYVTVVTGRTKTATLNLIDASSAWIQSPDNTTLKNAFTAAVHEEIEALHEVDRVVLVALAIANDEVALRAKLTADLQALQNRVNTFENRLAAFKQQFTAAAANLTDAQKAAIVAYFRANDQFSFNLDSLRITLTASPNNVGFTLTVTVSADGVATSTVKLAEFEKSIKRWLIVEWGFHCKDSTRTNVVKRVIQTTDSLSLTLVGAPTSGASAIFCSFLVLAFAFLFH